MQHIPLGSGSGAPARRLPSRALDNLDRLLALLAQAGAAESARRTSLTDPERPYRALLAALKSA